MPYRIGKGRYIDTVIGVHVDRPKGAWRGEGEFKVYIDGRKEFPTLIGTGFENYTGLS